jgi:hypothetical protein
VVWGSDGSITLAFASEGGGGGRDGGGEVRVSRFARV